MTSSGLILAAGESRRMGGFPKALLEYEGERFLERIMRLFAERCGEVVVVLGAHEAEIRDAVPARGGVRYVVNERWRDGQTSSLVRGLHEIAAQPEGVLFTLTDHPAVAPETLDRLLAASGRLRIPRYRGERGHPIWFSREIVPELLSLPAGAAARDAIRAHYAEATWIDTEDAGILKDIDDRAAYRALTGVEG